MGKKSLKGHQALTTSESLRRHSNTLERHIHHSRRLRVKQTIEKEQFNISFATQDLASDLLREVKREVEGSKNVEFSEDGIDSEDLRQMIRQKQRESVFEQKLVKSQQSYEKTSKIFQHKSLRQKYAHLLNFDEDSQEQKTAGPPQLDEFESTALSKIKQIYKRFRVSSMYKLQLCKKVSRKHVQTLQVKGYIRIYSIDGRQIVNLTT